jgi:hypothetical protein
MMHVKARWARVNDEPREYLVAEVPYGDEFVEVEGEVLSPLTKAATREKE